jgi:class 3 adenylate cyclase
MDNTETHFSKNDQSTRLCHPRDLSIDRVPTTLIRCFAFLDLSGFTTFCATSGPLQAHLVLKNFRSLVRNVCAQRGVRVSSWHGDGALLVGASSKEVVACCCDIVSRQHDSQLAIHGGVATGSVVLVDGDDYTGLVINLAGRLCEISAPNSILADSSACSDLPDWISKTQVESTNIRDIGIQTGLQQLCVSDTCGIEAWSLTK